MIYFLYGADSLRRGRKLKELLNAYRRKYENPDILEIDFGESDEVSLVKDFLGQPSLFVAAKVLILKNSGEASEEKELARVLKTEIDSQKTFVFISDPATPKKTLAFLLKDPVASQEFPELSLRDLKIFIQKESENLKIVFEPETLNLFAEQIFGRAESRSWHALRELEKIALLGEGVPISKVVLNKTLRFNEEKVVFQSAKRILFERTFARSLAELESLFVAKESPAYIFNSLGFQARGGDLVRLAKYDESIKSGHLEYEEALLDFVLTSSIPPR